MPTPPTTSGRREPEVLALARALVATNTVNPPGREAAAADLIARFFDGTAVEVTVQPLGAGRANLVARLAGAESAGGLLLSGHLDTVPTGEGAWHHPPFGGVVDDGRLYGRGAADMKGAVAAMAVALRDLARTRTPLRRPVVLALTAGEEADGVGASALVASDLIDDVAAAIVGEPSGLRVATAHRGALWLRVEAEGRAGHGSRSSSADNAVRRLLDWLDRLDGIEALLEDRHHPLLGRGGVSLNAIGGGHTVNVVPDRAFALLDLRTVPGHDHAAILRALERREPRVTVRVLRDAAAIATPADAPLVAAALEAVREVTGAADAPHGLPYLTDASTFVEARSLPAVVLGPGHAAQAHTEDEWVAVDDLEAAVSVYKRVAERIAAAH